MELEQREDWLNKLNKCEEDLQSLCYIKLQPLKYRITSLQTAHGFLIATAMDAVTKTNKFLQPGSQGKHFEFGVAIQSIFKLANLLKIILSSELYADSNDKILDDAIKQLAMLVVETMVGIHLKSAAFEPGDYRSSKHLETFNKKTKEYFEELGKIEQPECVVNTIKIKTHSHRPVTLDEVKLLFDEQSISDEFLEALAPIDTQSTFVQFPKLKS